MLRLSGDKTITTVFVSGLSCRRSLLGPCWFVKHNRQRIWVGQFLMDVDDFNVSAVPQELDRVKKDLMSKCTFGKWLEKEGDFIFLGRHLKQLEDRALVDQEKYILESLRVVDLARGRRSEHNAPASPSETRSFAILVYQLNWVEKESRPEVVGVSSMLASHVVNPTIAFGEPRVRESRDGHFLKSSCILP